MKRTNSAEKPYNKCLPCQHRIQKRCDGPRTSAMPLARWCEFMRDLKEMNGLTNQEVADRSGVSVKTIERIMAMNCDQDIMRETARRIEDAIIGSSNQYPCYLAFEEANKDTEGSAEIRARISYLLEQNESLRKQNDFLMHQLEVEQKRNELLWQENRRKSAIVDKYIESKG